MAKPSIISNFNKADLQKVSNIHEVTIFNAITDEAINGLMQDNLSLNFQANYSNIKDYTGDLIGGTLQKVDKYGIIPTNMITTAQIYESGDYLDLVIKLRITDSTGDGTPMKAATLLGQWTAPWDHKWNSWDTTQIYIEDKINNSSNKSRLTGESPHAIRRDAKKGSQQKIGTDGKNKVGATKASGKASDAIDSLANGNAGDAFTEILGLVTDVKLTVMIGDWFFSRGNMILKSVQQNFSREQGPAGPLYVDFDLQLQSLTVLTKRNVLELFPLIDKVKDGDPISSYAQIEVAQNRVQDKPVPKFSDEELTNIRNQQDFAKEALKRKIKEQSKNKK